MKKIAVLFLVVFSLALYSCGGDDAVPTTSVDVASGTTITTTQKITLTFSKSMDTSSLKLTGTMADDSNGGTWSKGITDNDTLTIAPKTKWDGSSVGSLVIAVKDPAGKAIMDQDLSYAIKVTFKNYQAASVVIGQTDFTSSVSATTQSGLDSLYSSPSVENGVLVIGDYGNNRTLKFNKIPTSNGASANVVIGEPDFTTSTGGTTSSLTSGNENSVIADGKLFVHEYGNSRVLIFNTVPTTDQHAANFVVGQPDFVSSTTGCSATQLNNPEGMFAGVGKLIVTDSSNNRVMIWNNIPITNGKAADIVLGQADFTHCLANGGLTVSAKGFDYPSGVWTDGTRLVVAEYSNNRVLIWNKFPTVNNQAADVVLGQPNFTTNALGTSNKDFLNPYMGVYSNGAQLFITDYNNNRVLIWNTFPTTSYKAADVVLGQPDFTSNATGTTNKNFSGVVGLTLSGDKLLVTDGNNNRVLIFQGQ